MAEDKKTSSGDGPAEGAVPANAGGGIKAWLPLILALVLMPALAFGMTKFLIVPELQKNLGIKSTEGGHGAKAKTKTEGKKTTVTFNKLLVNIAGTMGSRYLLVSLTVVGSGGEEFKSKVSEEDARLRDMCMSTLRTKTLADLEKPGSVNIIRTELINGFNTVLGDNAVLEIYITEFGIQ
jgi:flagellar protein FliL